MAQERNIKELLQLMLDHQDLFEFGLCRWIMCMRMNEIISLSEYNLINDYFYNNGIKPLQYLFDIGKIQPRINWIDQQLQKLDQ